MKPESVLDIVAHGAWNGGILLDNTIFEKKGMSFKGGIPVTSQTIEDRIGVRTRLAAPPDVRIGRVALQNLLETSGIDPSRIKLFISATNVGDDKEEKGPQIQHSVEMLKASCPGALAFDLYSGCPGFNVAVELVFMLSLNGFLKAGDVSVLIGAENLHRAHAFKDDDTANIIFGDDALASALETQATLRPAGTYESSPTAERPFSDDFVQRAADMIYQINGQDKIDGIIVDNQLGKLLYRVPATAARIQHALVERKYPERAAAGHFRQFKEALGFYDQEIKCFAFDVMTLHQNPGFVETLARAYVESGRYKTVASVYLDPHHPIRVRLHRGANCTAFYPKHGIIDALTRTHGCFGGYIEAIETEEDVFGVMDGKGVFLYATRGARKHLNELLHRNGLNVGSIELLIEHQANFAMIPMTIQTLFDGSKEEVDRLTRDFVAKRMVMNIHTRGNCSVVCMQRLPYDLQRNVLQPDVIQGYEINQSLEKLKNARLVVSDSVGAGMTRSSFIRRVA